MNDEEVTPGRHVPNLQLLGELHIQAGECLSHYTDYKRTACTVHYGATRKYITVVCYVLSGRKRNCFDFYGTRAMRQHTFLTPDTSSTRVLLRSSALCFASLRGTCSCDCKVLSRFKLFFCLHSRFKYVACLCSVYRLVRHGAVGHVSY